MATTTRKRTAANSAMLGAARARFNDATYRAILAAANGPDGLDGAWAAIRANFRAGMTDAEIRAALGLDADDTPE